MSTTTIGDLNNDCLMKIFSFLTIEDKLKTEEVCQRWLNVSLQGWPDVKNLKIRKECCPTHLTTILHRCGRFLQTFNIFVDNTKLIDLLQMTNDYCPQLKTLELCGGLLLFARTKSSNFHLRDVFSKLPELHTLRLDHCVGHILDDHLSTLSVENLKDLKISSCSFAIISVNVSRFFNLQRLSINRMTITDDFVRDFEKLEQLTSLCLLDIDGIPVQFPSKMASLKNLTSLEIGGRRSWRVRRILDITRNCLKLTHLSLVEMYMPNCLLHDIAQLQSLQTLEMEAVEGLTDSSLNGMQQIRALRLDVCPGITSQGLMQLIKSSTELRLLTIGSTETRKAIIENVNDAILCRESRRQFTLEILRCSPLETRLPENLSPLLTLVP